MDNVQDAVDKSAVLNQKILSHPQEVGGENLQATTELSVLYSITFRKCASSTVRQHNPAGAQYQ